MGATGAFDPAPPTQTELSNQRRYGMSPQAQRDLRSNY